MEIIVELNTNNTEFKEEMPYNITVTVYLDSIWKDIKERNRLYLSTELTVPIVKQQKEEIVKVTLHEYYDVKAVTSNERGIFIVMKGYIEGSIVDVNRIVSRCFVWSYDCV